MIMHYLYSKIIFFSNYHRFFNISLCLIDIIFWISCFKFVHKLFPPKNWKKQYNNKKMITVRSSPYFSLKNRFKLFWRVNFKKKKNVSNFTVLNSLNLDIIRWLISAVQNPWFFPLQLQEYTYWIAKTVC